MATIKDLTVEIRDNYYTRISRIPDYDLVGFQMVKRFNNVGYWELSVSNASPIVQDIRTPSNGIVVQLYDQIIFSGNITSVTRIQSQDDPEGIWKVVGSCDNQYLQDYLCWPAAPNDDPTNQDLSWYARSGIVSTLMYDLVNVNIGELAGAQRSLTNLIMAPDPLLGDEGYISTKWDTLGHALSRLAYMTTPTLRYEIVQDSDVNLVFSISEIQDHTNEYRFDIFNNQILRNEWTYTAPDATIAIVGGLSDGIDRIYQDAVTDGSIDASIEWGRRIETFIDNKSDFDRAVLTAQGQAALKENGSTKHGFSIVPNEDVPFYRYGTDFKLGDTVTVTIEDNDVLQTITEFALSVADDGIRQTLGIGNVEVLQNIAGDAPQMTIVGRYAAKTAKLQARVKSLEASVSNTSAANVQTVGPGITAALGDASYFWGINLTGSDIDPFTPVIINGTDSGFPTIEIASSNALNNSYQTIDGLTVTSVIDGKGALIARSGRVAKVDTSAFADGDILYIDDTGSITATAPQLGEIVIEAGYVLTADIEGSFFFNPVFKPYVQSKGIFEATITAGTQSIPSDSANYTRIGNSTTANQQWTVLQTDADRFSLSTSSGTRGILTVLKAGRYSFYAQTRWGSNATGKRNLRLSLNSGTGKDIAAVAVQAVDTTRSMVSRPSVYLNAGDTVAFEVLQTSGSAQTMSPSGTAPLYWYIEYIGG